MKIKEQSFAEELKDIRRVHGLTQQQMAFKLKIPYRTYQAWESGCRIPPDYTQAVVKILANED